MSRKQKRERIDKALKEVFVPFLRAKGFKGSLPHFRRVGSDRVNLLTIQHSQYDTKFVVEIANCSTEGILMTWGEEIQPSKCKAHDMSMRHRLGSETHNTDYWFDYGKFSLFTDIYKKRAKEIIELWEEANQWWKADPYEQRLQKENTCLQHQPSK